VRQIFSFNKKDITGLGDDQLIDEYKRSHDNKCIGELYKRYAHLVFGVCLKYLKDDAAAQDMVMEVFEKLLTDLKNHEVQNFKSWLYMVSKNQCLMLLRKQKGHESVELKTDRNEDDDERTVENELAEHLDDVDLKETQLVHLEEGITTLNHEQKLCVELFYLQHKSYIEVAEITGYDLKQVKSYIQNGKRNLKLYLEKKNA
jgi:RNA polymerase sigma-70 factor (ECF subfamily)